jgi:hypothetical protein
MITSFINKKNVPVRFITQQYEVGLYLAVYEGDNPIPQQTGLDCDDEGAFHRDLRKNYNKKELTLKLEGSTPLDKILKV